MASHHIAHRTMGTPWHNRPRTKNKGNTGKQGNRPSLQRSSGWPEHEEIVHRQHPFLGLKLIVDVGRRAGQPGFKIETDMKQTWSKANLRILINFGTRLQDALDAFPHILTRRFQSFISSTFSAGPNNPNPCNINTTRWVVIHPGALAKRYPVPGRTFLHGPFGDRDNWVSQTTSAITHWIIMWTIGRKPHFLATNRGISCEPSNPFNSRNPMITQRSPKCSQCHIGHGGAARSFSTQGLVCSDFFGAMRQSFWVPGRLKHRRTVPWYVVISHNSQVKWPSNHHEFANRPLTWSSCFQKIPQIGCDISRCASWVTPVVVLPESILLWWCESSLCWSVKQVELSRNVWIYDDFWSLMSLKLDLYIWDSTKDGQSENL